VVYPQILKKNEEPQKTLKKQTILRKNNKTGSLTLPDFKKNHKIKLIKTV
jgi:hypothetical protein